MEFKRRKQFYVNYHVVNNRITNKSLNKKRRKLVLKLKKVDVKY